MRILIAAVTAGAGHLQAAVAMEEAWQVLRPKDEVRRVDVLDFASKPFRKTYASAVSPASAASPPAPAAKASYAW